jgi:transposase
MEETSLLSLPEGMRVEHIQITEHGLVIEVVAVHSTSCCPLCAQAVLATWDIRSHNCSF